MHQTSHGHRSQAQQWNNWHADKPFLLRPATFGKKEIDGEMFYRGKGTKLYKVDLFDKMFAVTPGKVKPLYHKGQDKDTRHISSEP